MHDYVLRHLFYRKLLIVVHGLSHMCRISYISCTFLPFYSNFKVDDFSLSSIVKHNRGLSHDIKLSPKFYLLYDFCLFTRIFTKRHKISLKMLFNYRNTLRSYRLTKIKYRQTIYECLKITSLK